MLSHDRIWAAIDKLADRNKLTPSGLARRAGLDATTFNRSKRIAADGRERWPSTESVSKILQATGDVDLRFPPAPRRAAPARARPSRPSARCRCSASRRPAPAASSTMAASPPARAGTRSTFPAPAARTSMRSRSPASSMMPLYRDGDIIIVVALRALPARRPRGGQDARRRGDGQGAAAEDGAADRARLAQPRPSDNRTLPVGEVEWMARIIWASQ